MHPDREEAATGITPEKLTSEVTQATRRLRDQAWKITSLPSAPRMLRPQRNDYGDREEQVG